MATNKKQKEHYVDNKVLYENMKKYVEEYKFCKANNLQKPIISDEIAIDIMKIANRTINISTTVNYPFRDEMVADSIENCLLYAHNFNPEYKSKSPFSYFTMIIRHAFMRRIKKEKQYLRNKYGAIEQGLLELSEEDKILTKKYGNDYNDLVMREFIEDYDRREEEKKREKLEKIKIENNLKKKEKKAKYNLGEF